SSLTMATSMIGTPMYMAPEQFQGKAIDRRVDIYSSGVVLYQLVTGRAPFSGTPEMLMYKAVHEMPVMPSQLLGVERADEYDAVLARALAKNPNERFATALAFRDALMAAVGRAINDRVSEATIVGLKLPLRRAESGPPSQQPTTAGSSLTPGAFDRAQLAQAEATLARVIGPMASLMVKRAARECPDLPALYARLAEQVTDPAARKVFISHATQATGGTGGTGGGTFGGALGSTGGGSLATVTALSPALLDVAQRLLAQQVGPIAKVLVKKAVATTSRRDAFIDQLAQAVSDPAARRKFVDELSRLG
ncbi:MAG: protein kinase, partial [Burkholderiales bacterium]|nr:protein kinase [Burkholderiales bacterium]